MSNLYRFKTTALLIINFILVAAQLKAQISGTVFRDYNGDGIRQTTSPNFEPGVAAINIKAYDADGTLVSTSVSANDGSYSMPFTVSVRVEFSIPNTNACVIDTKERTGFSGDGNNIRFVDATTSTLNYGILFPDDFTPDTNPMVFVPVYHAGDPLAGGDAGTINGFNGFTYNSDQTPSGLITASANNIGTVWGVAYSKQAKKVFTSAFIKRQAGLGPLGSGGIYMLEPTATSFNVTQFYDMDANGYRTRASASALPYGQNDSYTVDNSGYTITYNGGLDAESGFPEGLGVVGTNVQRTLPASMAADSYDPAAFDQVGKVGLGDLDISDDGKFLFVMNLYSRKVYRLELNDAYNPTSVIAVTAYAIPNIAVTNGVLRPFAIQFHKDKIYVGAVASGENGGDNTVDGPTDLYAYIFEMTNPTGSATFNASPMLTYPLNYQKGYAIVTINSPANNKWFPWNNNSNVGVTDGAETAYPTPVLSNIEFTDRGDMIMSFFDRSGHQQGYYNYKNLSTTTTLTFQDIGGDVLIASLDCATGSFILENDGTYNSNGVNFSGYTSNNEGPGNGEFFYHEYAPDQYHHETSQGACAIVRGSQGGIYTLMDPVGAFQGGVGRFYSDNGTSSNRTVLYNGTDGEFSKANGLGDIEFAGEEPPIELGNRVWYDVDKDGIQDAGENGIPNISINLFCDTDNNGVSDGSAIATTLSDADGNWYFNKSNVPDGDCLTTGNQIGLQPNKSYIAKIGTSNWAAGIGVNELSLLQLTTLNAPVVGIADASDNDATIVAATPQIVMSTTKFGFNNHTYDFGFKTLCIEPVFTLTQTAPTCSGATSHNDGKITLSAVTNGTHYGISAGGTYTGPTTIATATAIVGTPDVQTSIPNTGGTYIVRIFNDVDDCYTDQTVTILPVVCSCPTGNCLPITIIKN